MDPTEPRGGALLSSARQLEDAIEYRVRDLLLPQTVDYRPMLGKPRDQGGQSSCVGFATAAIMEYYAYKLYGANVDFSAQFIYNCRTTPGDGMFPSEAANTLFNWGCATESTYPYGDHKSQKYMNMDDTVKAEAMKWRSRQPNILRTLDSVKSAVANNGPCIMAFTCYNTGRYPWRQSGSQSSLYGHCLTIVGYDTTGFILRNSWGSGWADGGYTHMDFTEWALKFETWTMPDAPETHPGERPDTSNKSKSGCGGCTIV